MAATLSVASPSEIEAIYRESHALWGAGLSYSDYVEFWADVRETKDEVVDKAKDAASAAAKPAE